MIQRLQQYGLTPGKAALMAVLAIGLGVVWGPQLAGLAGGSQSASRPVRPAAPRVIARSVEPTKPTPSAARPAKPTPQRRRPEPNVGLAEALGYDPFAPPAWSPASRRFARSSAGDAAEPTELEERFETIRQSGVAMILVSGEGRAAQVGDRTLRVGDLVDGFEVVEINDSGVVFRPSPEPGDGRGA